MLSTVFILINAPRALQFTSPKNGVFFGQNVGKYANKLVLQNILDDLWPLFSHKTCVCVGGCLLGGGGIY